MVEIDIEYEGDLHCRAGHGPSHATLVTDAPVDNQGRGEAFSPTDLLATSLGVCMMTVMGIYARRNGVDLKGTKIHVTKEMVSDPRRRVGKIGVTFALPKGIPEEHREPLERAAHTCPVALSLHPDVSLSVVFRYGA